MEFSETRLGISNAKQFMFGPDIDVSHNGGILYNDPAIMIVMIHVKIAASLSITCTCVTLTQG